MNNIFKKILLIAFCVCGICFAPDAARAQYSSLYGTWNNPMSAYLNQKAMDDVFLRMRAKAALKRQNNSAQANSASSSSTAPSARAFNPAASSFRPVAAQIIPEKMAAQIENAEQRAQGAKLYEELLTVYTGEIAAKEPRLKNNVAGAITVAVTVSYAIAKDGAELTERQEEALFQALNEALGEAEDFQKLDARGKQEMYEIFAITGTYMLAMNSEGREKEDKEMLQQAKEMANETLKMIFGLSPDKIVFTDEGVTLQN